MLSIPRSAFRRLRTILRKGLPSRPRGTPSPVVFLVPRTRGCVLYAVTDEVVVGLQVICVDDSGANVSKEPVLFPTEAFDAIDGTGNEPVCIASDGPSVVFHWIDRGAERSESYTATTPLSPLPRLTVPKAMIPVSTRFTAALDQASRCAAREPGRYALQRVQIRGAAGEIIGTDAQIAIRFDGFTLPFAEDLLVPAVPLFGLEDWSRSASEIRVGRTSKALVIAAGDLTAWLRVDTDGSFPDLSRVLPQALPVATVIVADEDTSFLRISLPELPVADDQFRPVTLDVQPDKPVVVRAADRDGKDVVEATLPRSKVDGDVACHAFDRRYLARLLAVQANTWKLHRGDKPLIAVGDGVTVLIMPLDPSLIVPPSPSARVLASTEPTTNPVPIRRTTVKHNEPPTAPPATDTDGEPNDPLAEAEALRAALAESLQRLGRLVTALRTRRKEQKALTQVWSSLKNLQLGN